jgi:hypothetical protein
VRDPCSKPSDLHAASKRVLVLVVKALRCEMVIGSSQERADLGTSTRCKLRRGCCGSARKRPDRLLRFLLSTIMSFVSKSASVRRASGRLLAIQLSALSFPPLLLQFDGRLDRIYYLGASSRSASTISDTVTPLLRSRHVWIVLQLVLDSR